MASTSTFVTRALVIYIALIAIKTVPSSMHITAIACRRSEKL